MIAVLLSDGFEEVEALTPVDMLRREGFDVKTVGISGKIVAGAHKIPIICDIEPNEVNLDEVSLVIFPGGMPGALNLDASPFTDKIISAVTENGGRIAAICAAPLILGRRGLLDGKRATCYPGFENELKGAKVVDKDVVTDGNITTARGMTVALDFANELVAILTGKKTEEENESGEIPLDEFLKQIGFNADEWEDADEFEELEEIVEIEDVNDAGEPDEDPTEKIAYSDPACYDNYEIPPVKLLKRTCATDNFGDEEKKEFAEKIVDAFRQFNVAVSVNLVEKGPRFTKVEISPKCGVEVRSITELFDDIALNLNISNMRMHAPALGTTTVSLEIPNEKANTVYLGELLENDEFKNAESKTIFALGKDVVGTPVFADIKALPHVIITGSTCTGKSVFINSIITSILYKARPDEVKFILIDPKSVEFTRYNGIPHLLLPVITDVKQAAGALMWAIDQMENRYELMETLNVRNLDAYNDKVRENPELGKPLSKIIIVIDELNDIMLQVRKPAEELIMSIAQKARAAGIHLIIGTQRPSIDVITGVIKANIPSRISFKLATAKDSKNVLEQPGAEFLLNNGDMLYLPAGTQTAIRIQGPFVSDAELCDILSFIKSQDCVGKYDPRVTDEINLAIKKCVFKNDHDDFDEEDESIFDDPKFIAAVELTLSAEKVSTSLLQRRLSIGYSKAAKIIDYMEEYEIVSPPSNVEPRKVLITEDEWKKMLSKK